MGTIKARSIVTGLNQNGESFTDITIEEFDDDGRGIIEQQNDWAAKTRRLYEAAGFDNVICRLFPIPPPSPGNGAFAVLIPKIST